MVGAGCAALQQRVSPHVDLPNPNTITAEFQGSEEPKVRIWRQLEIVEIFKCLDAASSLGFWRTNGTHLTCI